MPESTGSPTGGRLNQDIAKEIVRAQHHRLGRGSPKARAFWNDELLVVAMHDPFTKSEQSLLADGRGAAVREMRAQSEEMLEPELVDIVERLTARRVEAFLSVTHVAPALVVEVFVLDRAIARRPDAP
jgi:uncharacterized protein YbcI